ncbi:flavin-containing monooxygenase [Rhizobium sp. YIM 134829]|uniref:flavin-containing monooxygenase n=1 Tax=Rhizobium sp. YIM 134829 TaxID=3390453 RepID=UPI00397A2F9B
MRPLYRDPPVLVIGAGLAGLTVAHHLLLKRVDCVVLEAAAAPGASWAARHPQLTLNTHRDHSTLPGLRYPKGTPAFPSRDAVIDHLQAFAGRADFPIRYGAVVTQVVAQDDGGFTVTLATGERLEGAHLVIATGRDRLPLMPAIEGAEGFGGILRHASALGRAKDYQGQRVLVIGGGNSGFDVVNHLSKVKTDRLWLSVRGGASVLPKRLKGLAVHRLSPMMERLPSAIVDPAIRLTERLAFGRLQNLGFPQPEAGAATRLRRNQIAIPVDDGTIASIKAGRTTLAGPVARIEGTSVVLHSGERIEPDIIIAATGYESGLSALLGHLPVLDTRGHPRLSASGPASPLPNLWFAGMRPNLVSYFHGARQDGMVIADAAAASRARTAGPLRTSSSAARR